MYSTLTCGYLAHTYTYVLLSTIAAFLPVYYSQACATQVVVVLEETNFGNLLNSHLRILSTYLHILLPTIVPHKCYTSAPIYKYHSQAHTAIRKHILL